MTDEKGILIFAMMNAILSDIKAIEKNQKNAAQGFMFRGVDQVYNELHDIFAEHQVFVTEELLSWEYEELVSKSGSRGWHHKTTHRFTFWAVDGSSVSTVVGGEGIDYNDSGINKCGSIAQKYALLRTFLIPTSDDKDPDAQSHDIMPTTTKKATSTVKPSQAGLPPAYKSTKKNTYDSKCHLCKQPISSTEGIMAELAVPETYLDKKTGEKKSRKYHYYHDECFAQETAKGGLLPNEPTPPDDLPF
jgi:hypothetical protein